MPTPVDNVFFALVVVGLALRAWWGMRTLRAAPVDRLPAVRRALWLRAMLGQWALVALLAAWWAFRQRPFAGLGITTHLGWGFSGVLVGVVLVAGMSLRQRGRFGTDASLRARVRERLANVQRLMPGSRAEWPRFAALAVTAGICEEFLFRGFVVWMLSHVTTAAWQTLVAQGVLFGLAHAYQGARGVLLTGAVGIFMGALVWVTGGLWAPMLVHALMDLNAGDLALRSLEPAGTPAA